MQNSLFSKVACIVFSIGSLCLAADKVEQTGRTMSLAQVGYQDGFHSESPRGALTFYLPLPQDPRLPSAVLDLALENSALAGAGSNVRISVNGVPRTTTTLAGRGQGAWYLPINLTARELDRRYLEVSLHFTLKLGKDRCEDQALGGGFFRVLPETALRFFDSQAPSSLRSFLARLPHEVTVAVPDATPSVAMLHGAWLLADSLQRAGRKVHFSNQSAEGQILVASPAVLSGSKIQPPAGMSLFLHREGAHSRLVLTEPFEATLAISPWKDLLTGSFYGRSSSDPAALPFSHGDRVPLSRFGLQDGLRHVAEGGEWHFYMEPRLLPSERRPGTLVLDVLSGAIPDGVHLNFYIYVDGVLVRGEALKRDGRPQTFLVPISSTVASGPGRVRMVVSRLEGGDCSRPLTELPFQVLPTSHLLLESDNNPKEGFRDLARGLTGSCEVFIDTSKGQAPQLLALLLQATQALGLEPSRTSFHAPAGAAPKGPFLWFGPEPLQGFTGAVRFDKGSIQVLDGVGARLLDTAPMNGLGVAQVIRKGSARGVWFRGTTADGLPPTATALTLDRGDLVFFDTHGTVLSLDSREEELMKVNYPGHRHWLESLASYRTWFLALLWLAATAAIVVGYRKFRQKAHAEKE